MNKETYDNACGRRKDRPYVSELTGIEWRRNKPGICDNIDFEDGYESIEDEFARKEKQAEKEGLI